MPLRLATLATCSLNQWAMDFDGNIQRIKESIVQAKRKGATYRVGPELEVPGYGCEDHFNELDTVEHSWECLAALLRDPDEELDGIVWDIGMPIIHRGVLYNCRVLVLARQVLLIRPKLNLANDGNYRETRYFATWKHRQVCEEHSLPRCVQAATKQDTAPFGDGVLRFSDTLLASETCEELFTPLAPHIDLALAGVEIISNGSGSHHQLRKLDQRLNLIRGATAKVVLSSNAYPTLLMRMGGGVYLYANQRGCDGGRLYYDGCACIAINGELVAQGSQFALGDVEVVTATVDLDVVVSYRGAISSLREQASSTTQPHIIRVDFDLARSTTPYVAPTLVPKFHLPEEEIAYGPACWLWDYLRRSGGCGFLLPLSGGADSAATAAIVGTMCQLVVRAADTDAANGGGGDATVLADARRIGQYSDVEPLGSAQDLAGRLFHTVYMGSTNSSAETCNRASTLAKQIGAHHTNLKIDALTSAVVALFTAVVGKTPRFRAQGGSTAENLALQNIQARMRMVLAFLFASLLPWVRGRTGFLLVLGSANVDECLRGYLTKYDCSSADVNPIGGISKGDLKRFLRWGAQHLGYSELAAVEAATPTAELEPFQEGQPPQSDEVDMGMTYEELGIYGRLRKVARCGPVSTFRHCLQAWHGRYPVHEIATKVKDFFRFYAINRHKSTVLTPSYHAESYSPDDNRFDHRQFLYNVRWPWQFKKIDELVDCTSDAPEVTAHAPGLHKTGAAAAAAAVPATGDGV